MLILLPFIFAGFFGVVIVAVSLPLLLIGKAGDIPLLKRISKTGLWGGLGYLGVCLVLFVLLASVMLLHETFGPNTRTEPNTSDLAGIYQPTKKTFEFIRKKGYPVRSDISIKLDDNGRFNAKNIPDMYHNDFGIGKGKFESFSGGWELESDELSLVTNWGLRLHRNAGSFGVSLKNQKSPYIIDFTIGDPDSGEHLFFEKVILPQRKRGKEK